MPAAAGGPTIEGFGISFVADTWTTLPGAPMESANDCIPAVTGFALSFQDPNGEYDFGGTTVFVAIGAFDSSFAASSRLALAASTRYDGSAGRSGIFAAGGLARANGFQFFFGSSKTLPGIPLGIGVDI